MDKRERSLLVRIPDEISLSAEATAAVVSVEEHGLTWRVFGFGPFGGTEEPPDGFYIFEASIRLNDTMWTICDYSSTDLSDAIMNSYAIFRKMVSASNYKRAHVQY